MINWLEKHPKISWLITIIIATMIFALSSMQFKGGQGIGANSIFYHFFVFFFLSFFLLISLTKGKNKNKFLIFLAIMIAILYGISDELHQLFVPTRYSTFQDMITNSIGVLFAGVIYCFRIKR